MLPDAGPFDFDRGSERGVLCLHGFTGTPFEMRPIGERLAGRGFTAVGPLLPGHGRDPATLNATTWRDWTAAVGRELEALRRRCRRVAIAGLSLGGLLALHAALRQRDVAALCLLATPLWLPRLTTAGILLLHTAWPDFAVPKPHADIHDPVARRAFPLASGIPLGALASLVDFMPRVRARLPEIEAPALVLHGDHDHVVPPACARELVARLGSRDKRLLRLPRSYHIVTVDLDRERVTREVSDFLAERM